MVYGIRLLEVLSVVAVREAPLHLGHLRQLALLAEVGAVIFPPVPTFYDRPRTLDDIVNYTVGRILDRFGIPQTLVRECAGTGAARSRPASGVGMALFFAGSLSVNVLGGDRPHVGAGVHLARAAATDVAKIKIW